MFKMVAGEGLVDMTDDIGPVPDGGQMELTRDPEDDGFDLGVDLPEDSLFDLDDYLEMYRVASKRTPFNILMALNEAGELSTSELSMKLEKEGNELHYHLRKLKRVALIRNRRDPNTGTKETYSYYVLTDLGRTVLTEGIAEGVRYLAREEAALEEKYSR